MSADPYECGSQSLDIGGVLKNGVDDFVSMTGAQLVAAITVVGLLNAVLWNSLIVKIFDRLFEYIRENTEITDPEVQQQLAEAEAQLASNAFALDLPIVVILVALFVLALVTEAISIVGIRAFANEEIDGIPSGLAKRRLPIATLYGFISGILVAIAIGFGTLVFIIPGIFIFVATIFFRQEIAVADKGPLAAISGSWNLTKGNRLLLFALAVILFIIGAVVGGIFGTIGGIAGQTASTMVNTVISSVVSIFSIAIFTDAYVRLRGSPGTNQTSL